MRIFSSHQRKLEPHRRFGSRSFRDKIKQAQNYKRSFGASKKTWSWASLTPSFKLWRNIAIALVLILAYYLFLSPRFKVEKVEVSGNQQVSSQAIEEAVKSAGNPRLFFLGKGRMNSILTNALPTIKEVVEYGREWPNAIRITISERVPGFVIESNDNYFLVDEEGVVVSQVDGPGDLLVIEDQVVESFATNEPLPNTKLSPFVMSMVKQWPNKLPVPVSNIKFPGKGSAEVQFETAEGWSALFATDRSVNSQLSSLTVILNKQISAAQRAQLAYIDLRLSKFAYYCFKASPCEQHEQVAGTATDEQE